MQPPSPPRRTTPKPCGIRVSQTQRQTQRPRMPAPPRTRPTKRPRARSPSAVRALRATARTSAPRRTAPRRTRAIVTAQVTSCAATRRSRASVRPTHRRLVSSAPPCQGRNRRSFAQATTEAVRSSRARQRRAPRPWVGEDSASSFRRVLRLGRHSAARSAFPGRPTARAPTARCTLRPCRAPVSPWVSGWEASGPADRRVTGLVTCHARVARARAQVCEWTGVRARRSRGRSCRPCPSESRRPA